MNNVATEKGGVTAAVLTPAQQAQFSALCAQRMDGVPVKTMDEVGGRAGRAGQVAWRRLRASVGGQPA